MMRVIIVTGGIGSGKSLVCRLMRSRGIPVYDSDSAAKALYEKHPELKSLIVKDIFSKPEALKRLEDAVYPLLAEDFRQWAADRGAQTLAFESAIVLQKDFFDNFGDYVLLVEAPVEERVRRAVERGGEEADVRRRIALQKDQRENPRVDFIIENDSSVQNAEEQLDKFLKKINYYGN